MKSKKIIIFLLVLVLILAYLLISKTNIYNYTLEKNDGILVVPTMDDKIATDSVWCGTFQLAWNDLKNEYIKKDIILEPQPKIVNNLNKESYDKTMLSPEYYYNICGTKTLELKDQIINDTNSRFGQVPDILNNIDWSENELDDPEDMTTKRIFLYSMLYRNFEYLNSLSHMGKGDFGSKYQDISYFGVSFTTQDYVREQFDVLYYKSEKDFAILINTKTNDEVIFCKNPEGETFSEIYNNMNKKSKKFFGSKKLEHLDIFETPYLEFFADKEYDEMENQVFETNDSYYKYGIIEKAVQSISFSIDQDGGEIKSEAGLDALLTCGGVTLSKKDKPRYFVLDDTYTLFLREKGKTMPYFAVRINDITKFQNNCDTSITSFTLMH